MRDFRWMGKPMVWEKDHRHVTLEVPPDTHLPSGPLLLAVSDESFLFEASLNVPPKGGFAGLCIYHLDTTFAAIGVNEQEMEIHTAIGGFHSRSLLDKPLAKETLTWVLKRSPSQVGVGYRYEQEPPVWIGSFQLPGIAQSISFGPYFTNETEQSMQGFMQAIRYTKEA